LGNDKNKLLFPSKLAIVSAMTCCAKDMRHFIDQIGSKHENSRSLAEMNFLGNLPRIL